MSVDKKIIMIAGPNGAGKTTFAREFLPVDAGLPTFINADLIAAELSPSNPAAAAIRAGRMMLTEIDQQAAAGEELRVRNDVIRAHLPPSHRTLARGWLYS